MAADALKRGFSAVAIARGILCRCCGFAGRSESRIVNHRVRNDSPAGHYSLLVEMDDKDVVLHDPMAGPSRKLGHAELLELWLPQHANSEIVGAMLIAIAPASRPPLAKCEFCHVAIPRAVTCRDARSP